MTWLVLILSLAVIWVASLYKAFYGSGWNAKATCWGDGESSCKRNVILITAHPDDESMFFSPAINYLISKGYNLRILCFSTGDADGLGSIRKDELYHACAELKIPTQHVKCLDHPDLQDGFGRVWNHGLLAKIIEEEVSSHGIDLIITFDNYGVSGHCNHRDVHFGVKKFLRDTSQKNVQAWELVSSNLLRKYSGPIDIWLPILCASEHHEKVILNDQPRRSFRAMARHSSQWIWFRKLFVSLSSYTYLNTLRKITRHQLQDRTDDMKTL